ncbi:MAG: hypothetical protein EOM20_13180 [Spartobacteria bacterium]|nr:hypothetical protein [Spartobacteria bacterium]
MNGLLRGVLVGFLGVWLPVASHAAYSFLADGGSFVSLEVDGVQRTYYMGYSSSGAPGFDGADLGVFSLADSNTLILTAFTSSRSPPPQPKRCNGRSGRSPTRMHRAARPGIGSCKNDSGT